MITESSPVQASILRVWRVALFPFLVCQLAFFVATFWLTPRAGDAGFFADVNQNGFVVTSVYGSGARLLRPRDVVPAAQLDRQAFIALVGYGWAGDRVNVPIVRDGTRAQIALVLGSSPSRPVTPGAIELLVVGLLNLLLGALIAARARLDLRTLLAATFLMATGSFGIDVGAAAPGLLGIALQLSMGLYYGVRYTAGSLLIWTFPGARNPIVRSVIAVTVVVIGLTTIAEYWLVPIFFPFQSVLLQNVLNYAPIATNVCFAACWIIAASMSGFEDRSRLRLFALAIVPWCLGVIAENLLQALPTYRNLPVYVEFIARFFELLLPVTLAYALLVRRIFDIGFAMSRAAVYTIVSAVIVGIFVLAEWSLSEWTKSASHATNIAVSATLALLLGLSIRFVHAKVEHFVDRVMFRKRREDEEAIRKMAHEAPYITDEATLLDRVQQTLLQHAGSSFARVLLDDGGGSFCGVTENDPTLVSLRAEHARVDLHATKTDIEGEWAYPMVARGRLVGALVLGPKKSKESYAPDESAAIAQLAHSAAGAIDVLSLRPSADTLTAIRTSLDTVAHAIAAQSELLRSLVAQTNEKEKAP